MDIETVTSLYEKATGGSPTLIRPVAQAGSNRSYYRVEGPGGPLIATCGADREENEAFIYLSEALAAGGANVPRVLAVADDRMAYIQDDLGDVSLFQLITYNLEAAVPLLERTMEHLAYIHYRASEKVDFSRCYPRERFDRRSVMWDLNYFKYDFLKATGIEYSEDALENDFERMADMLLAESDEQCGLMLRDCQSRNVMIRLGRPYFIDFQSGRRGPGIYDVASFIGQARAGYPEELRHHLVECYLDAAARYTDIDREAFMKRLRLFLLFRTLQVLGAYGFRGYFEQKSHFIASIPQAIENLRNLIKDEFPGLEYLTSVLNKVCSLPRYQPADNGEGLTVRVWSFSYRKGIPADDTANGGGFVFDCRSVHNPGRYDAYKQLTGLDAEVKEFLERGGEMTRMMEHAYGLVDDAVAKYIERGFTSLQICFGCTGGRHRSVYGAQAMAEHVSSKFGVRVELCHRERGINQTFPAV